MSLAAGMQPFYEQFCVRQGALTHHPSRNQFPIRRAGNPDPSIARHTGHLFDGIKSFFLFVDERPQLVLLACGDMQVTKMIGAHARTVFTQAGQPATDRVFVYCQDARAGTDSQAFRQQFDPEPLPYFIQTNAGIRRTCPCKHERAADTARETERMIMRPAWMELRWLPTATV